MKLIKITNGVNIVYDNTYRDFMRVEPGYRRLQLNTLKKQSAIHIFFNEENGNDNLIEVNEPFYVRVKENIRCYNSWEVQPTLIEKGMELHIESIDISFGITKYMLCFKCGGSNISHFIDPEYVDFIGLASKENDSKPEVKKVDKNKVSEPEIKNVTESDNTKSKTKTKSKTTSRKTKSTTTAKNKNISKNIKNICDVGRPGITLDNDKLKELNESINDDVNKLCALIELKDKIDKIISVLSESSENIKISDSEFNLSVKIIPLDHDIVIPSSYLFDIKDINELVLDFHKKKYDSIKNEIEILKGQIFKHLDILLTE